MSFWSFFNADQFLEPQGGRDDSPCRFDDRCLRGPAGASAGPDSMCPTGCIRVVVEMAASNDCADGRQPGVNHGWRTDRCLVFQEEPANGTRAMGPKSESWA